MKHLISVILCAMLGSPSGFAQDAKKKDTKETVVFAVENMHCENCVKKVEKNISFEKGVTDLKCDLKNHTVEVTYRTDKTTEANLVSAFKKLNMDAVAKESEEGKPGKN